MAVYRYLAYDLRTNVALDELPLADVSYGGVLNRPGPFSATLKVTKRTAQLRRTNSTAERTIVYVERDGTIQDAYIIWTRRTKPAPAPLQLTGASVLSFLYRNRIVTSPAPFTNVDQFTIAFAILTMMQTQVGADIGIIAGTPSTCGVVRNRTFYAYERKNIGVALEQLAEVNNGFDLGIDITKNVSGVPVKTLNLSYPRRGRIAGTTGIIFELGKNLIDYEIIEDGTRSARSIDAYGGGDGADMLISTQTNTALIDAGFPLTSDSIAHKDVIMQATLDAHARSAVDASSATPMFIRLRIKPDDPDGGLGHWILGDDALVRIPNDINFPRQSDGSPGLSGYYRLLTYDVDVPDAGKDIIWLTAGRVS